MLIIPHSQWLKMSNFTRAQWGDFELFTRHAFIYIPSSCHSCWASTTSTITSDTKKKMIWIDFFGYFLLFVFRMKSDYRLKYTHLYVRFFFVSTAYRWMQKNFLKQIFRLKTFTRKTESAVSSQSVRWGEWKLFNQVKIIIFLSKIP